MRLPAGVRDWLPHELARKRDVEARLRAVFGRWSYQEVQTPAFERLDVLESGLGDALAAQSFRFSDRRANALALRPEMTTPIARLVTTRMREAPLPLRLSYVAAAYRYEEPQEGRMREFTQAGTELIGMPGVDADAECLFMAVEALDEVDLRGVRFDINDANLVDGVLEGLRLDPDLVPRAKALIAERNLVALRDFARPQLIELTMMRGTHDLLEAAARYCRTPSSLAAIDRLADLLGRAQTLGVAERVTIDFALLRDFEYYTGFIFEGYVEELGFSLAGGGRYDTLLPRFGYAVPAVGWSAGVERILIALERRGKYFERQRPRIDVLVAGSDVIAARERAAGNIVRIAPGDASDEALVADARAHGIPRIVTAANGHVRELRVPLADGLPKTHRSPFHEAST